MYQRYIGSGQDPRVRGRRTGVMPDLAAQRLISSPPMKPATQPASASHAPNPGLPPSPPATNRSRVPTTTTAPSIAANRLNRPERPVSPNITTTPRAATASPGEAREISTLGSPPAI